MPDSKQSTQIAIDGLERQPALSAMLASQSAAVAVVQAAIGQIDAAAGIVAETFASGHILHYAAAGSSGLMALSDASELPGTFGVAQSQIRISMAGGVPQDGVMPGDTEDDIEEAVVVARTLRAGDTAIVVSASGTTPYALAFARAAQSNGARIIAIANVPGSALLDMADVPVLLDTGPEVIAGSTRLGAGTAQKVALNMISTQAGILLGHVHDGLMVNLNPDNIKLRKRAADIVQQIAGVQADQAIPALEKAQYNTKLAVLLAVGAEAASARELLEENGGRLRKCLAALEKQTTPTD